MKSIDAVIFDWGNTLVDYPLDTPASQVQWLASFLREAACQWGDPLRKEMESFADDQESLYRFNQEMPDYSVRGFEGRLREALSIGFSAHIALKLERQLCRRLFSCASVIEGAEEVVLKLKQQGVAVGVVSNTPWGTTADEWRLELESYNFIRKNCDATVFCRDVGFRKPHPAAFIECLQRLTVAPVKTLVIGDNLNSDVAGAHAAGCKGIWFDRKSSEMAPQNQPAVKVLTELLDMI